jgi:hypothetical protein
MSATQQLRMSILSIIIMNPSTVRPIRRKLESDGVGGYTRTGTKEIQPPAIVRIASESSGVPGYSLIPVGIGSSDSFYVITDFKAPLCEGDEIEADGIKYRVGPVHLKKMMGSVIGSNARLEVVA